MQLLGPQHKVMELDAASKTLTLASGDKVQYQSLISTMPLDLTLTWLGKKDWADGLTHRCDARLAPACASHCWLFAATCKVSS